MPLEEIRNLLDGAIDLPTALAQQKDRLKAEQERIQGAILFCEGIQERKLEELDVDNSNNPEQTRIDSPFITLL